MDEIVLLERDTDFSNAKAVFLFCTDETYLHPHLIIGPMVEGHFLYFDVKARYRMDREEIHNALDEDHWDGNLQGGFSCSKQSLLDGKFGEVFRNRGKLSDYEDLEDCLEVFRSQGPTDDE
tara:strand:+ start:1882 stop:2244 length:363 start_codon:yes stop_codon:yes gene_type:complete